MIVPASTAYLESAVEAPPEALDQLRRFTPTQVHKLARPLKIAACAGEAGSYTMALLRAIALVLSEKAEQELHAA